MQDLQMPQDAARTKKMAKLLQDATKQRELVNTKPSNAARSYQKMAKLEGDEKNADSQMEDLQMLQNAARRRR